jgi:transposase
MGIGKWQTCEYQCPEIFFKSFGGRYKRIRKRCKGKPEPTLYALKVDQLSELEKLSRQGAIDLFYGDESHVCSEGYTPYGWQFPGEDVYIPVEKGFKVNIWGLISRSNQTHFATTHENINASFVFGQLEYLSFQIQKQTVVVLDNASMHKAKIIQNQLAFWEARGLYIFYLPPYSPELNIAETLWRKIKKEQIDPIDYANKEALSYAVNRCLARLGKDWKINFSDFNIN